ncbi:MAG: hypothetical protein HYW48_09145 [Deltaproteobacteria bacterium]|nr:hypothetical protein [Deltaproteobacteria bacterium]
MKRVLILASILTVSLGCQKTGTETEQKVKGKEITEGKLYFSADEMPPSDDLKLKEEQNVVFSEHLGLVNPEEVMNEKPTSSVANVIVVPNSQTRIFASPSDEAQLLCEAAQGTQFLRITNLQDFEQEFEQVRLDRVVTKWGCPESASFGYLKVSDLVSPPQGESAKPYLTIRLTQSTRVFSNADKVDTVCTIEAGAELLVVQDSPLRIQLPIIEGCPPQLENGYIVLEKIPKPNTE